LISTAEVARLAGVSVSSIRRWRDEDPDFPPPRVLGDRTLRWTLGEVLAWIESRPRADGAAWAEGMDLAEREVAGRRARDEAAARRLDQPVVPGSARTR
jgi:predicted DNA-binding transcriptional regulator AlpA